MKSWWIKNLAITPSLTFTTCRRRSRRAAKCGCGVDLAVNLVGGSAFPDCQRALADFGRQVVVGYVDGQMKTELDLEALHGKVIIRLP